MRPRLHRLPLRQLRPPQAFCRSLPSCRQEPMRAVGAAIKTVTVIAGQAAVRVLVHALRQVGAPPARCSSS